MPVSGRKRKHLEHTTHHWSILEHEHLLQRTFTVRFRCLLDNTSGFVVRDSRRSVELTMEIFSVDIGDRWTHRHSLRTETIAYTRWSSFVGLVRHRLSIRTSVVIRNSSTGISLQSQISTDLRTGLTRSEVRARLSTVHSDHWLIVEESSFSITPITISLNWPVATIGFIPMI